MKNQFIISGLSVVLLGFGLCAAPVVWAADATVPAPTERPSAVTELDGRVESIDLKNQQLALKDTQDHIVTLQIVRQTVISSAASSKLTLKNLKTNDKIHVYYTTADKKARQIDVSPALPVMRDLETH